MYEKSMCCKSKKTFSGRIFVKMLKAKSGVAPLLADEKDKHSTKFATKKSRLIEHLTPVHLNGLANCFDFFVFYIT